MASVKNKIFFIFVMVLLLCFANVSFAADVKTLSCNIYYTSHAQLKDINLTPVTTPQKIINPSPVILPKYYIDKTNKRVYSHEQKIVQEASVGEHSITIRDKTYRNNDIIKIYLFIDRHSNRSVYKSYTTSPNGSYPFGLIIYSTGEGTCRF